MSPAEDIIKKLSIVHKELDKCRKCPGVCGTPVHAHPIVTKIMAVGQAPGIHEAKLGKPFAFTAGKTLFKWLKLSTDLEESELRDLIYFTAVARCFPGKSLTGAGDREPTSEEINNCRENVRAEVNVLQPTVLLAIGRVAIAEILGSENFPKRKPLHEVVGRLFQASFHGVPVKVIPLPHPSGVSRWPQTNPGKTKLAQALDLVRDELIKLKIIKPRMRISHNFL